MKIETILRILQSEEITALNSLFGIIGFFLTLYAVWKTHSIDKAIKKLKAAQDYNESRLSFSLKFKGFCDVISREAQDRSTVTEIISQLSAYKNCFEPIILFREKIKLFQLSHQLKKEYKKINFRKVSNCLAELSGRLEKREET